MPSNLCPVVPECRFHPFAPRACRVTRHASRRRRERCFSPVAGPSACRLQPLRTASGSAAPQVEVSLAASPASAAAEKPSASPTSTPAATPTPVPPPARPIDPLDWPNWRGPEQNGISRETNLIDRWIPTTSKAATFSGSATTWAPSPAQSCWAETLRARPARAGHAPRTRESRLR